MTKVKHVSFNHIYFLIQTKANTAYLSVFVHSRTITVSNYYRNAAVADLIFSEQNISLNVIFAIGKARSNYFSGMF